MLGGPQEAWRTNKTNILLSTVYRKSKVGTERTRDGLGGQLDGLHVHDHVWDWSDWSRCPLQYSIAALISCGSFNLWALVRRFAVFRFKFAQYIWVSGAFQTSRHTDSPPTLRCHVIVASYLHQLGFNLKLCSSCVWCTSTSTGMASTKHSALLL